MRLPCIKTEKSHSFYLIICQVFKPIFPTENETMRLFLQKERLKRQNRAFGLSFKWLWQSLALVGSDKEMRKKKIREVETLSNHYPMETP